MKILRLNAFSSKVYGVNDAGDVFVARSGAEICELGEMDWQPVPVDKVPVTLRRWMEEQKKDDARWPCGTRLMVNDQKGEI